MIPMASVMRLRGLKGVGFGGRERCEGVTVGGMMRETDGFSRVTGGRWWLAKGGWPRGAERGGTEVGLTPSPGATQRRLPAQARQGSRNSATSTEVREVHLAVAVEIALSQSRALGSAVMLATTTRSAKSVFLSPLVSPGKRSTKLVNLRTKPSLPPK